jgi:hypothetical protein
MASKKNLPPGDIRLDPLDMMPTEQPLSNEAKQLVKRAYELYDFFREQLREEHEEMRSARAMRQLKQDEKSATAPASNTLNSCIDNVIADQIDNMPEAKMVPEREETADFAEEMSDVIAYLLYQSNWQQIYRGVMEDAVVTGTGVVETLWDDDAEDGEGMARVIQWHPEDFYPDPAYENIQDGRGVFKATRTTVAWVDEHYPHAKGYVKADRTAQQDDYWHPKYETPGEDQPTTILEFWYKRWDAKKRKNRVHKAILAGHALLFSTELSFGGPKKDEYKEGVYAHGRYPFDLFRYRDVLRRPFGTGLVHDYRDTQIAIDRYQKYIDDNARESACQRYFVRESSGLTADQIADMSNRVLQWKGNDIREVLQISQAAPLNGQVYQMMTFLVDNMKQDSGQNQFNRGEGGGGVTAASAISQLVAQGGKITRWHVEQYKNAFREMIEQLMWVVSEYMDPKRKLLIVGGWESGMGMQGKHISVRAPSYEGDSLRKPGYSVRVQAQKHSPIWSERFNELLMKAAEIAAQSGTAIPPETLVGTLQGFPDKGRIVRVLEASSAMHAQIAQLQQQNEQLANQVKGLQAVAQSDARALGAPSIAQAEAQNKPAAPAGYADLAQMVGGDGQEANV